VQSETLTELVTGHPSHLVTVKLYIVADVGLSVALAVEAVNPAGLELQL
jgi:hypothetical protein